MKKRLAKLATTIRNNKIRTLIFLLGSLILLFPIVSQVSYYLASHQNINRFEREVSKMDTSAIDRRIALTKAYNETVSRNPLVIDPFTRKQKEGLREYARMLEVHEQITTLQSQVLGLTFRFMQEQLKVCFRKVVGIWRGLVFQWEVSLPMPF